MRPRDRNSQFTRRQQAVYIIVGYLFPLTGSILGVVFIAIHGTKFGPNSVPVSAGGHTVLLDGPPEYYLISFWLLTCLQIVLLLSNIIGPCSCDKRLHFSFQAFGIVTDFIYLVMVNTSVDKWPPGAKVQSPRIYFNASSLLMLTGQVVLAWGAYRLSGCGCERKRTSEEVYLRERARRLAHFGPVWAKLPQEQTRSVHVDYEDEELMTDEEVAEEVVDELVALYPNTVMAEMLQLTGKIHFDSIPDKSDNEIEEAQSLFANRERASDSPNLSAQLPPNLSN